MGELDHLLANSLGFREHDPDPLFLAHELFGDGHFRLCQKALEVAIPNSLSSRRGEWHHEDGDEHNTQTSYHDEASQPFSLNRRWSFSVTSFIISSDD